MSLPVFNQMIANLCQCSIVSVREEVKAFVFISLKDLKMSGTKVKGHMFADGWVCGDTLRAIQSEQFSVLILSGITGTIIIVVIDLDIDVGKIINERKEKAPIPLHAGVSICTLKSSFKPYEYMYLIQSLMNKIQTLKNTQLPARCWIRQNYERTTKHYRSTSIITRDFL